MIALLEHNGGTGVLLALCTDSIDGSKWPGALTLSLMLTAVRHALGALLLHPATTMHFAFSLEPTLLMPRVCVWGGGGLLSPCVQFLKDVSSSKEVRDASVAANQRMSEHSVKARMRTVSALHAVQQTHVLSAPCAA